MKAFYRVSERALLQRINRKLGDDLMVKTSRSPRMRADVGRHYLLNVSCNFISRKHVDIEELGRELGALAGWERLEEAA